VSIHPTPASGPSPPHERRARLRELATVFLRLGATSIGGPAAHIALMEHEFVRRRGWLSHAEFLDLVSASNLVPGPTSTEVAMHVGWERAGRRGLVVAGTAFILPAALIVLAAAVLYETYGARPEVSWLLRAVKPAIVVIVAAALARLGRALLTSVARGVVAAGAALALVGGVHELAVLAVAGLGMAMTARRIDPDATPAAMLGPLAGAGLVATAATGASPVGLWPLFAFFAKVGAVLFGSGYVLLAFLQADLVDRWGWITEAQLLDAIAIGQVTPGPVFTTATFLGYLVAGYPGAVVATVGIFLPGFLFVAATGPILARLRRSATAARGLLGLNLASLALMAVVTGRLAESALVDAQAVATAALGALVLWRRPATNPTWIIGLGVAMALMAGLLRGG
jgi:chromate transporter